MGEILKKIFLKNGKKTISFTILVLALFVFYFVFTVRADIAQFYPSSCLGGWQNPQNAQGRPDLGPGALPEEFDKNNSALLNNLISQIFCGNFEGETPQDANPRKTVLKFLWLVSLATGDNQQKTEEQEISTLIQVIEINSTSTLEQPIQSQPEPQPETQQNSESEPVSFWQKLFNVVFAQEISSSSIETTPEITPEIIETTQSASAQNSSTTQETETSDNSSESTSTPTTSTSQLEPFLEIFYTLDGANWQSLGKVDSDNWKNLQLEIPNFNWEDASKLQISLKSLSPVEFTPTVYLDGMWLEVEYEQQTPTSEEIQNQDEQIITEEVPIEEVPTEEVPIEETPSEEQIQQEENIKPEQVPVNLTPIKESFYDYENPEFILTKIKNESIWEKIKSFFGGQTKINEAFLTGPDGQQAPAEFFIKEENDDYYKAYINKPNNWQAGRYLLEIKVNYFDKIYTTQANFEWLKKPEKHLIFNLNGQPLPSQKYAEWHPEFNKIKTNIQNNVAAVKIISEESGLIFEGKCQKEYFVILGYRNPDDYKNVPTAFIYNKAFSCQNGFYRYELNDLSKNSPEGIYYFFAAEQGKTGPWYPISAIQPVEIKIIEK